MAIPQNSNPNFTAGGNVFQRIAAQWNAYFSAKVDAQSGQMDSPSITGQISAGSATLTVGQLHVTSGTIGGLAIPPIGVSGSGATTLLYDNTEFAVALNGNLQLVSPIKVALLPVATTGTLGIVMPDGSTITINAQGQISTNAASLAAPTGVITGFGGTNAPAGWLICNGQAVSRSTYSALYTIIGTAYGTGDGSTTFNVPDMRGRVGVGYDPSNTTGRMTAGTSGGISAGTIGGVGGEQYHYLGNGEIPSHQHPITDPSHFHYIGDPGHGHPDATHSHRTNDPGHAHNVYDPGHAHSVSDPGHNHAFGANVTYYSGFADWAPVSSAGPVGGWNTGYTNTAATGIGIYGATTGIGIYGSGTGVTVAASGANIGNAFTGIGNTQYAGTNINQTGFFGTGNAHNNTQPGQVINYIIKT